MKKIVCTGLSLFFLFLFVYVFYTVTKNTVEDDESKKSTRSFLLERGYTKDLFEMYGPPNRIFQIDSDPEGRYVYIYQKQDGTGRAAVITEVKFLIRKDGKVLSITNPF